MKTLLLSMMLSGCSLLSPMGNYEVVTAKITGHTTEDVSGFCSWAGMTTEFVTELGDTDSMCGNHGEVGAEIKAIWSYGFRDKGRNGLHIYNEEVLDGQRNSSGWCLVRDCVDTNPDSH